MNRPGNNSGGGARTDGRTRTAFTERAREDARRAEKVVVFFMFSRELRAGSARRQDACGRHRVVIPCTDGRDVVSPPPPPPPVLVGETLHAATVASPTPIRAGRILHVCVGLTDKEPVRAYVKNVFTRRGRLVRI